MDDLKFSSNRLFRELRRSGILRDDEGAAICHSGQWVELDLSYDQAARLTEVLSEGKTP